MRARGAGQYSGDLEPTTPGYKHSIAIAASARSARSAARQAAAARNQTNTQAEAARATGSLDQDKLADYMHIHSFDTVVCKISLGKDGEWSEPTAAASDEQVAS